MSETRKAIDHYSYALNEEIGRGFSSKVYKGRDENNSQPVAVKVIDMKMVKQSIHSVLLKNEINALKSLNSSNILKLYDVFQT
jgi:serine/threonine protein kinase